MFNNYNLKNKVVVITGASGGIGRELVKLYLKEEAIVYACLRNNKQKLLAYLNDQQLIKKLNILSFDISNEDEVKIAINEIKKSQNNIDILVNNAAIAGDTIFQMTKLTHMKETMDVNFFSVFNMTQRMVGMLRKSEQPSILNISSVASLDCYRGMVAYSTSKAAVNALTLTLSKELAIYGIRVNAIAPGFIKTDMLDGAITNQEFLEKIIDNTTVRRLGEPKEIANVAVFLTSNLASYINGQILRVDGGSLFG